LPTSQLQKSQLRRIALSDEASVSRAFMHTLNDLTGRAPTR